MCAFGRSREARRGDFSVLDIEHGADQHDLAVEMTAEEILVILLRAGTQVGEREGRDVTGAGREIERNGVRHGARSQRGERRTGARSELRRHRRHALTVDREGERHAPDHAVGIAVDVERADVAPEADGGALAGRRQHRRLLVLHLAEHDLTGARAERERSQVVAVEAAQARAERLVAERHCGLLDRGREHDVEAHDLGAARDDSVEYAADLGSPGDTRAAFEWCGAEGLLVERDHDGGRGRRRMRIAESECAQQGQHVNRDAAQRIEGGRRRQQAGGERDQRALPLPRRAAEPDRATRAGRCYCRRSRRLTAGAGPDFALAAIWNVSLWPPTLAS